MVRVTPNNGKPGEAHQFDCRHDVVLLDVGAIHPFPSGRRLCSLPFGLPERKKPEQRLREFSEKTAGGFNAPWQ
jgi:hypothetical protein